MTEDAEATSQPRDEAGFDTPPTGVLMAPDEYDTVDPEAALAEQAPPSRMAKSTKSLLEWVVVIAIALTVALAIRTWVFQPFWIPSESMVQTLQKKDRVLVNKLSYRLHDIHRGDVVVFEQPDSWPLGSEVKDLIKRVIGLPGDEIRISGDRVYVGGRELVEPYIYCPEDRGEFCTDVATTVIDPDQDGKFVVPEDMVFVMGDNRTGSSDSRYNGFVPESNVVGRAFVVIWPVGHWSWL